MLDAGNDRDGRACLSEMPRPRLVEGRIVLAVGEIDLRVHDVLELRSGQRERGRHPLGDDEFGLELDRLPAPLQTFGHQRRRRDPVATRLVADRRRRDARNEDEVANRDRRRIAGGRTALELLVLEVRNLKTLVGDDTHGLDVHVSAGQQQALLRDRCRRRDAPAQKFPAHLLIGRHRLHGGVVLVCAYEVAAVGAGGAQHGIEILEDAQRFLLALGQARMRCALRKHVRRDAVDEILPHQPGGEDPTAGLHALGELDLA